MSVTQNVMKCLCKVNELFNANRWMDERIDRQTDRHDVVNSRISQYCGIT